MKRHLDAMREARDDVEQLNAHDAAFHRALVHVGSTEQWLRGLREHLSADESVPERDMAPHPTGGGGAM